MMDKVNLNHSKIWASIENRPWFTQKSEIYFIKSTVPVNGKVVYKIGRSIDPYKRIDTIGHSLPFLIEIISVAHAEKGNETECLLHALYAPRKTRGEWFAFSKKEEEEIKEALDRLAVTGNINDLKYLQPVEKIAYA